VAPDDRVVRENVCQVILRVGQQMRDSITREVARNGRVLASVTTAERSIDAFDWEI
jgi:hypothetical protein